MTWLDDGQWGPTGDPDTDFPPESRGDTGGIQTFTTLNPLSHRSSSCGFD